MMITVELTEEEFAMVNYCVEHISANERNFDVDGEKALESIARKFNRHEYVTEDDWRNCFESFNSSKNYGTLKEVTKE